MSQFMPILSALPAFPALLSLAAVAALVSASVCARASEEPPPSAVAVEQVIEDDFAPRAGVLGTTEPRRQSDVSAEIEGYVVEDSIREGQRVAKGDLLVALRDSVLRLEIAQARALLDERRERHKRAQLDLERARELIGKDAVTQKELDAAVTEERALAAQVLQAEARVAILESDLTKKRVVAPFAGQVVAEHAELGEWVARGGMIATLVDLETLYIRVHVPERYVRFIREDQEVEVRISAAGDEVRRGRIDAVSGAGDPLARTFAVRIEVPNDGLLRAGMSARVEIPAGEPRRGLAVPKDAVLLRGGEAYVYVVGEGNVVDERAIVTGSSSGGRFEVLRGLEAGETVVVEGNERISPRTPVRIVPRSRERQHGS